MELPSKNQTELKYTVDKVKEGNYILNCKLNRILNINLIILYYMMMINCY